MATVLELRLCDSDRERFGGPEWFQLDVDALLDTPARQLRLYEAQTGYAIERAIDQAGASMPAVATQVLVWLGRKQGGHNRGGPTGEAEPFSALDEIKAMRVSIRRVRDELPVDEQEGDDADPPASSTPEPSSAGD